MRESDTKYRLWCRSSLRRPNHFHRSVIFYSITSLFFWMTSMACCALQKKWCWQLILLIILPLPVAALREMLKKAELGIKAWRQCRWSLSYSPNQHTKPSKRRWQTTTNSSHWHNTENKSFGKNFLRQNSGWRLLLLGLSERVPHPTLCLWTRFCSSSPVKCKA